MTPFPNEIIYLAVNRWDSMVQREQLLMMGLSRSYRILFVDPPLSFLTLSLGKIRRKHWDFRSHLHRVNEQLIVYSPPAFPPFSQNLSWIHRWNTHSLVSKIKSLTQEISFKNYILGISWPLWGSVLQGLKPRWSYYDCSDDYLNYPGLRADKERLRRSEEELLRSVNVVFCSSQALRRAKSLINPNCFLIPNGVDRSSLESDQRDEDIPFDMGGIRKPIIGYIGTIGDWLDFDTLIPLTKARPDWSIVMIGPVTSKHLSSIMARVPNLYWLGERDYNELPKYLNLFDVCLIPFKVNEFTKKIYPTKFHQYLGVGKPVVSSRLPDLEPFRPWVMFYDHGKEMEEAIERSLSEDSDEKALQRKRIASENTWDERVKSIVEIFNSYFKKK